jgi:hypothetical protein
LVDTLLGLQSSSCTLLIAMAESRIILNLLRRTAADSVIVLGRIGDSASLDSVWNMLLLKVARLVLVLVLCVCGGDFMMVVDKGYESGESSLHSVV